MSNSFTSFFSLCDFLHFHQFFPNFYYILLINHLSIMPSIKCCVFGCESGKSVRKHSFPMEDDDFAKWVSRTGNIKLKNLSKPCVRKSYVVCTKHFSSSCYSSGTIRLKKGSIPTLELPSMYYSCLSWCLLFILFKITMYLYLDSNLK